MKRQRPTVSITIDTEVHADARAVARAQGLTFSRFVEVLLKRECVTHLQATRQVRVARDPDLRTKGRAAAVRAWDCAVKRAVRAVKGGAS